MFLPSRAAQLTDWGIAKGGTVTFLLRKAEVFDTDEAIQSYVKSGKARLVKGDALEIEDVARGWAEAQAASETRHVDAVLFTVGQYKLGMYSTTIFTLQ